MLLKKRLLVLFLLHKFVIMLQMLRKTRYLLVNITINSFNCLRDSLKSLFKLGSLAMFKVI